VTTAALLDSLTARGVRLEAADGKLRWRPREALTAEDVAALAACKGELLALLTPPAPWDPAEADALVRSALALDYHTDPGRWAAVSRLADAVDAAFLAKDLAGLRAAVGAYRACLLKTEDRRHVT
jgi:hypothetical protein